MGAKPDRSYGTERLGCGLGQEQGSVWSRSFSSSKTWWEAREKVLVKRGKFMAEETDLLFGQEAGKGRRGTNREWHLSGRVRG